MANTEGAVTRPFPESNPDVLYGLAMDRLQTQQRQVDALDGKIGNLLGFGSALLAILVGIPALTERAIPCGALIPLSVAGAAYVGIAFGSLIVYYARGWEVGPQLPEAWKYAREYGEKHLAWWAAESLTKCYENNQGAVKRKVLVVRVNVALIALQGIATALGFLLIALN